MDESFFAFWVTHQSPDSVRLYPGSFNNQRLCGILAVVMTLQHWRSGRRLNAAQADRSVVQPRIIKKIKNYSRLGSVDCEKNYYFKAGVNQAMGRFLLGWSRVQVSPPGFEAVSWQHFKSIYSGSDCQAKKFRGAGRSRLPAPAAASFLRRHFFS